MRFAEKGIRAFNSLDPLFIGCFAGAAVGVDPVMGSGRLVLPTRNNKVFGEATIDQRLPDTVGKKRLVVWKGFEYAKMVHLRARVMSICRPGVGR